MLEAEPSQSTQGIPKAGEPTGASLTGAENFLESFRFRGSVTVRIEGVHYGVSNVRVMSSWQRQGDLGISFYVVSVLYIEVQYSGRN
jgi:hypothetical protein